LLFAVHPIHAEAVVTLYGQCDLWAAVFALWATALHLRWAAQGRGPSWWLVVAAVYLLSLAFKESAILLPPLLGVLRGLLVDRDTRGWRRWFGPREAIVAAAALALYLPLRAFALGGHLAPAGDAVVGRGAGLLSRVTLAVVAVATDLRLLVLPWGQTVYYGHLRDRLAAGGILEAVLLLVAVAAVRRLCTPERPWALAALAMFAIHLLPVANLIPIGVLVAERCLYLPSAGFALLVGGWVATWAAPPRPAMYFAAAAALIAASGIALSARVCGRWSDARSLWSNTLADHPRSPRAGAMDVLFRIPIPEKQPHLSTTQAAELRRQLDDVEHLNPNLPELWLARAALAQSTGDDPAAQTYLARAEALRPGIRRAMPFARLPSTTEH
jgi:hypothetical protein